jgi:hypothetical protein
MACAVQTPDAVYPTRSRTSEATYAAKAQSCAFEAFSEFATVRAANIPRKVREPVAAGASRPRWTCRRQKRDEIKGRTPVERRTPTEGQPVDPRTHDDEGRQSDEVHEILIGVLTVGPDEQRKKARTKGQGP